LPIPQSEKCIERNSFESANEVKLKMADLLNWVSADDLQHWFEQWKICMQRCIDKGGEYIEGDSN
jgi:hypothetical protein